MASDGLSRYLTGWQPPPRDEADIVAVPPVAALAGLFETEATTVPEAGDPLPPLWHWLSFLDWPAQRQVGPDGHPAGGHFLPPIPGRRRMFAGGRLLIQDPLVVGVATTRRSELIDIRVKQGRSGEMAFVTVRHEFRQHGRVRLVEEQDLMYRSGDRAGPVPRRASADGRRPDSPSPWQRTLRTDPTLLFRYSALTANAHRIHYDLPYARDVEGYPGLVVHGPLLILGMLELVRRHAPHRPVAAVDYRMRSPVFCGEPILFTGDPAPGDPADAGPARLAANPDPEGGAAEATLTFA